MHGDKYTLDIGCGTNKVKGSIGIDINKNTDADVICDIEKSLPFKDCVFDEIHCNQFIEHVSDLTGLMEEIHRIGKNHAKVFINAPYYKSIYAYSDPTHKRFITEDTFKYFTGDLKGYYTSVRFKINNISYTYDFIAKKLLFIPKIFFRRYIFNSTHGISFELEILK